MEKLYSTKTCLKMAGRGMHSPHTPLLDPSSVKGMLLGGTGKTILKCQRFSSFLSYST